MNKISRPATQAQDATVEFPAIPGQMTAEEMQALSSVCSLVRPGGFAVEIGSLFGLSSSIIAGSLPADATLFCIDPWVREPWIIDLVEKKFAGCPQFSKDAFFRYTSNHLNIVPLQGYSPDDFLDWTLEIDLVFEDSIHQNPTLGRTLAHWRKFLRKGGVICGHDYCSEWPDVILEVDRIAKELEVTPQTAGSFWWLES